MNKINLLKRISVSVIFFIFAFSHIILAKKVVNRTVASELTFGHAPLEVEDRIEVLEKYKANFDDIKKYNKDTTSNNFNADSPIFEKKIVGLLKHDPFATILTTVLQPIIKNDQQKAKSMNENWYERLSNVRLTCYLDSSSNKLAGLSKSMDEIINDFVNLFTARINYVKDYPKVVKSNQRGLRENIRKKRKNLREAYLKAFFPIYNSLVNKLSALEKLSSTCTYDLDDPNSDSKQPSNSGGRGGTAK